MNVQQALSKIPQAKYPFLDILTANGREVIKNLPNDQYAVETIENEFRANDNRLTIVPKVLFGTVKKPIDELAIEVTNGGAMNGVDDAEVVEEPETAPTNSAENQTQNIQPMAGDYNALINTLWLQEKSRADRLDEENKNLRDELAEVKSDLKQSSGLQGVLSGLGGGLAGLFANGGAMGAVPQGQQAPAISGDKRVTTFASWFSNQDDNQKQRIWAAIQLMGKQPAIIDMILSTVSNE